MPYYSRRSKQHVDLGNHYEFGLIVPEDRSNVIEEAVADEFPGLNEAEIYFEWESKSEGHGSPKTVTVTNVTIFSGEQEIFRNMGSNHHSEKVRAAVESYLDTHPDCVFFEEVTL